MTTTKVCFCLLLLVTSVFAQTDASRDRFWNKFRDAVIRKDKAAVANMSTYPISMPYGMREVRTRQQLIKRYRDVFNHDSDAAECFKEAKPQPVPRRPNEFSVGCKNPAGDEVVIYYFVRKSQGWKFNSLDNLNE